MKNFKRIFYTIVGLIVMLVSSCSSSEDVVGDVHFDVNTDYVLLKKEGGVAYLNVASNTKWTLLIDNEKVPVKDLSVTPLSGGGDETIKITYGNEVNQYPHEHATLVFYYYSQGERVSKEVILSRKEKVDEDDKDWRKITAILKYDYNNFSLMTSDGWKIKADQSYFMGGIMYIVSYQYKGSMIDEESKTINVQFLSEPLCIDASTKVGSVNELSSNAAVNEICFDNAVPLFYDKDIFIVPVGFYGNGEQEEMNQHSFELVYDSNMSAGADLKLTLRYSILGENMDRPNLTFRYCAFNLESILSLFGKIPGKVIIEYQKNSDNNKLESSLVDTYSLDYKFTSEEMHTNIL